MLSITVLDSRDPHDISYVKCSALLDTGATFSGIGPKPIKELQLRSHQKKQLSVATEMRSVDYYLLRLGFLSNDESDAFTLPFIFAETDGFSWREQKDFDVILGMDVISQCDLHIGRNGRWQLSFG